jgi:hypothetical protein
LYLFSTFFLICVLRIASLAQHHGMMKGAVGDLRPGTGAGGGTPKIPQK